MDGAATHRVNGVHNALQQVREVLYIGVLIIDVGAFKDSQRALYRELALLLVAVEHTTEVLGLHETLPNNRTAAIGQCHGPVGVGCWQQVFPIPCDFLIILYSLTVIHDTEITRLRADGCKHIVVIALLGGKRLGSTFQDDRIA